MMNLEEREKRAKVKARKMVIFSDIIILAIWIFSIVMTIGGEPINNKNAVIAIIFAHFMIAISCIVCMIVLHKKVLKVAIQSFIEQEEMNDSKKTIQNKLSTDKYVEVLPIKADKHEDFILGITDRAQIYAIINEKDNIISISIKFNDEEKLRHWENIYGEYFNKYYKIK